MEKIYNKQVRAMILQNGNPNSRDADWHEIYARKEDGHIDWDNAAAGTYYSWSAESTEEANDKALEKKLNELIAAEAAKNPDSFWAKRDAWKINKEVRFVEVVA